MCFRLQLNWKVEKCCCALCAFLSFLTDVVKNGLRDAEKMTCSLNVPTATPLLFVSDITSLLYSIWRTLAPLHPHLVFPSLPICVVFACLLPAVPFCFCVVCSRAERRTVGLPDERENFILLLLPIMLLPDQNFDVRANTTWKWGIGSGRRRSCQETTKTPHRCSALAARLMA